MQVAYITSPHYLDFSIEYINKLKKEVTLDVYVVLTNNYLKTTILNIKNYIHPVGKLVSFYELADNIENSDLLKAYVEGCHSFSFILFPDKSTSLRSVVTCQSLAAAVNKNSPSVIHFDDISLQLWSLTIFLKNKLSCVNVHDPEPHSGEKDWRRTLIRSMFYPRAKAFIVFSDYSCNRLKKAYNFNAPIYTLALTPYYFYSKLARHDILKDFDKTDIILLFFGRISKYKGIEELIKAFKNIYKHYPNLKLVIAGKDNLDTDLVRDLESGIKKRIILHNRFIHNEELAGLMHRANFVVCPYRDATQSGVVMTAFAFEKKVIVSRVGGLYEAVTQGVNGYIYDPAEPNGLEKAIDQALESHVLPGGFRIDDKYTAAVNVSLLLYIYNSLLN